MVYKKSQTKKHGFTLVEMLIIAPIVILVIGIFISAIISMTGAVLVTRGANALSFSINDALTRIDQDVKASAGFLATNNITLTTAQGLNDDTTPFVNASSSSPTDAKLILNAYATDQNPLTPTRNTIDAYMSPFACNSPNVSQNASYMINIVYFVKNTNGVNSLWRRVIMPSGYQSVGAAGGGCALPWQKPTCTPGYSAGFCAANDQDLVDGVSNITIQYYTNSVPPTLISNASDGTQLTSVRQAAMQTAASVNVSITAQKTLAGRTVTQLGSIRSLGIQAPTMLTQPTSPTIVSVGNTATITAAANGINMTTKWEQSTDNGTTWTVASGASSCVATTCTLTLTSVTNAMDGYMYHAIYTNSYGQTTSSPALLSVTAATGWNSLTYQNSWSDYGSGYNTGAYTKTSAGIVLLKGLIKRTGTGTVNETIAVLPVGYRPSAPLIFGVSTNPDASGRIDVYPDGRITIAAGDTTWMTLENIHFVADTGRYARTPVNIFMNGWTNYNTGASGVPWAPASYVVDNIGRVNLQGLLLPGTRSDGTRIFDLPSNLLPLAYTHIPEYGNAFAAIGINPTLGYSAINDKNLGSAYLTINAMYYPAGVGTWTNLTLKNSWAYTDGTNAFSYPQYIKAADGLVSLKGLIRNGSTTGDSVIATLPAGQGLWPSGRVVFAAYSNGAYSRIDVDTSGNIRFETGSNAWLSLDGMTFLGEN
jgi:type II secretory pathway pseudopilin PulG